MVQVSAFADREGNGMPVIRNMRRHIGAFDTVAPDEADGLIADAERAIEEGTFSFSLPQFLETDHKEFS